MCKVDECTIRNVHLYSAFTALMLLVGQQEGHLACKKTEWWDSGVVMCLGQGADLHMAQLMPLAPVNPGLVYFYGASSPG